MLLSVALMTMTMLGTALLPTHAQVGAAAGWLLFLLRCVMGFSVGGEYIAIVAYLLEGAPRNTRGLITAMASAFSEVGGLLAVGVSLITVNSLSSASLKSWGWRIPFLVGAVLAASIWIARTTMEESPEFERQQGRRDDARAPAALRPHEPSHRYPARLRHLCVRVNHVLCRDHLRSDISLPPESWARATRFGSPRLRRSPSSSSLRLPEPCPTGLAGNPC